MFNITQLQLNPCGIRVFGCYLSNERNDHQVDDLNRAKEFYGTVFNKELTEVPMPGERMAMFPYHQRNPNATGALIKSDSEQSSATGTLVYF